MREATLPALRVIRPPLAALLLIGAGFAFIVGLILWGAVRISDPFVAWFGVGVATAIVPIADWYRRTLTIDEEGFVDTSFLSRTRIPFEDVAGFGFWIARAYKGGPWRWLSIVDDEGRRIDVSVTACRRDDIQAVLETLALRSPSAPQVEMKHPRMPAGAIVAVVAAHVVIIFSFVLLGVGVPRTLGAERLFSWGAAAGLSGGGAVAWVVAPRLLPRAAMTLAMCIALSAMVAVPSAAMLVNSRYGRGYRNAHMTVLSHRAYTDKGKTKYTAELSFDGVPKRVSPPASAWSVLLPGATFSACLREGALGYPIILSATRECPR